MVYMFHNVKSGYRTKLVNSLFPSKSKRVNDWSHLSVAQLAKLDDFLVAATSLDRMTTAWKTFSPSQELKDAPKSTIEILDAVAAAVHEHCDPTPEPEPVRPPSKKRARVMGPDDDTDGPDDVVTCAFPSPLNDKQVEVATWFFADHRGVDDATHAFPFPVKLKSLSDMERSAFLMSWQIARNFLKTV